MPKLPSIQDAPALSLAGVIPFSATDWPGKLTVTVFTQGCPLRCVYCHNAQLQEFRCKDGATSFAEVLQLLEDRRGLLDGLVISGGEPLALPELPAAIATAKAAGFPVGLHTSGYAPGRLKALLEDEATRPNWIGLDVKALPRHTAQVTGLAPRAAARMWESVELVAQAAEDYGVDVQMRTTLWPGSVIEQHIDELKADVRALGHELVLQWARGVDGAGNYVD